MFTIFPTLVCTYLRSETWYLHQMHWCSRPDIDASVFLYWCFFRGRLSFSLSHAYMCMWQDKSDPLLLKKRNVLIFTYITWHPQQVLDVYIQYLTLIVRYLIVTSKVLIHLSTTWHLHPLHWYNFTLLDNYKHCTDTILHYLIITNIVLI